MTARIASLLLAPALCALAACAATSADVQAALDRGSVEEALEAQQARGRHGDLVRIAHVVLGRELRSDDPAARERAFAALRGAGPRARPLLERLSRDADRGLRARALSLRATLGDAAAQAALVPLLEDGDAGIRAAAVRALDARDAFHRARLVHALRSGFAAERRAALAVLRGAPADLELRAELLRMAASDPDTDVRVAAFGLLPGQGAPADALEPHLAGQDGSEDGAVRAAAFAALVRIDRARAEQLFLRDLAGVPGDAGIDAARLLLASGASSPAALDLLVRALAHADGKLRSRAATAAASMQHPELQAAAAAQLAREPARSIQLHLALVLPANDARRRRALVALAAQQDVVGTQAVVELARSGDHDAVASLMARRKVTDPAVRRLAVHTLGSELGRPGAVRDALLDEDAAVRVAAAAALL